MTYPLKRIVSGGQTGADEAGLQAAFDLGIPTGGTAPRDWRICLPDGSDGSDPELGTKFGLVEHDSYDYPPRTRQNVTDSDGTVWFGSDKSPGSLLTINTCINQSKPYIINPTAQQLADWAVENKISVLNVAGNRYSKLNPDIITVTYNTVTEALKLLRAEADFAEEAKWA